MGMTGVNQTGEAGRIDTLLNIDEVYIARGRGCLITRNKVRISVRACVRVCAPL